MDYSNNRKLLITNASKSQTRTSLVGLRLKVKKDAEIGIYGIFCKETNSVYIGQSRNIAGRFKNHKSTLKAGKHSCSRMQSDYQIFGVDSFSFDVIFNCEEDHLLTFETQYIKEYIALGYDVYNTVIDTDSTCLVQISKEQEPVFKKIIKALSNNSLTLNELEKGIDYILNRY